MEREIKFRAYDQEAKVMSGEFGLFGEFTLMGAVHDWQMEIRGIDTVFENGDGPDLLEMLRELKIMQFTGLRDKNGVEIYEGDILNHFEMGSWGIVKFHTCSFMIDYIYMDVYQELLGWYSFKRGAPSKPEDFEVIGNIYENPELLNQH